MGDGLIVPDIGETLGQIDGFADEADEAAEELAAEEAAEELDDPVLGVLIKARAILDKSYIKGALAKSALGYGVSTMSRERVKVCALGAVAVASNVDVGGMNAAINHMSLLAPVSYLDAAAIALYNLQYIYYVNDGQGKEATLRCFDWAIGRRREDIKAGIKHK